MVSIHTITWVSIPNPLQIDLRLITAQYSVKMHFRCTNFRRLYLAQYWCYVETIAKIRQVPSVDPMDVPIASSNEKISKNIMVSKFMNLKEILNLENVGHFDGKSKGILDWM